MNALTDLKTFFKRALPKSVVLFIKKVRHTKKISAVTIDEDIDFRAIRYLVQPGDSVIDLGANMGFYTKILSELTGSSGKVYSIEPIPSTVNILRYVVKKLHLTNVEVIHCAISDASGMVTMEIPLFESGEENIFEAKIVSVPSKTGFQKVDIESTTLDALFHDTLRSITFIKCDIEGHELQALKGAARFLQETKPSWYVEVWGNPDEIGSPAEKTFSVFQQFGYGAFWFDGTAMRKRNTGEIKVNYFFLTDTHQAFLSGKHLMAEESKTSRVTSV